MSTEVIQAPAPGSPGEGTRNAWARALHSPLRAQVETELGPLRSLPEEEDEGSPLWRDWDGQATFSVHLGRGECAS